MTRDRQQAFELVGHARCMRLVRGMVERVAASDLPVLVLGETGTGKEMVAQALHRLSGRPGALVAVNAAAHADSLLDNAMFGHVRGAFTGASRSHRGYVGEAHRGTLFLDEFTSLRPESQAKLLRVLETHHYRQQGSPMDASSDFRAVAATNESVPALLARGRLREDLLHRLNGVTISLPPLRERLEDLAVLADHFRHLEASGESAPQMTGEFIEVLRRYRWPGNVRELRATIRRALTLFRDEPSLEAWHAQALLGSGYGAVHAACAERGGTVEALRSLLEKHGWSVRTVAADLGVTRKTVYQRLKRAGLPTPRELRLTAGA